MDERRASHLQRRARAVLAVAPLLLAALQPGCATTRRVETPHTLPTYDGLVEASRMGFIDEVRQLLLLGISPVPPDIETISPLLAARAAGFTEVADLLVAYGADEATSTDAFRAPLLDGFASHFRRGTPAIVALVTQHGEEILSAQFGDALLGVTPVALDTQFRIGSITKQFTAVAILLLQQDGRLSVQDPLSRWLPQFPRGDEITLHHLLTHTSGIPSYTEAPGFFDSVTAHTTTDALIDSFAGASLAFEPGTDFAYSNSGYVLLGAVVEAASGSSYADFLSDRIFRRIGMRDTGIYPKGISAAREARGYAWGPQGIEPALAWDMSQAAGAGALYSTALDLARWNDVLFGPDRGVLLSEASLAAALTNYHVPSPNEGRPTRGIGYGYGFGLGTRRGIDFVAHSGGLHGFGSYLAWVPDAEMTIVVLHNAAPSPYLAADLAAPIMPLLLWPGMETRRAIELDPAPDFDAYDDWTGRYRVASVIQSITRDGDRLYSQLAGQPKYEIFPRLRLDDTPRSETPFFYREVDAQLSFVRDESGTVTHVRHEQDGAELAAPKLPRFVGVPVPSGTLDDYAGRYDYGGAVLTVTREGDRLFAQLEGQDRYEIHARSENVFRWLVVDARITFVRAPAHQAGGDRSPVTHVVHEQNGRSFEAPRVADAERGSD